MKKIEFFRKFLLTRHNGLIVSKDFMVKIVFNLKMRFYQNCFSNWPKRYLKKRFDILKH